MTNLEKWMKHNEFENETEMLTSVICRRSMICKLCPLYDESVDKQQKCWQRFKEWAEKDMP